MRARLTFLGILLLSACQGSQHTTYQVIDFGQVDWYAERANAAYATEADIRREFPDTVLVATTQHSHVQYFLERDHLDGRQIITIRGTDNLRNVKQDADYIESRNPKLGIFVHNGFDQDTIQIFQNLLPQLDKAHQVIITGHSLGAAIGTLLMMYLYEEGFDLGTSINFGQPKVTNHAGVEKYQFLPLLRVVDENDLVPLVPPADLIDVMHGAYEHLGAEVMLLQGQYYVYEPLRQAEQDSVNSFWKNLGDESISAHFMKHYLQNVISKLEGAREIPYDQREHYITD